jgi:hypothetical protein
MPHLPSVIDAAQLPLPERMAASLDGELFPLAAGHCVVDEANSPALRLAAVLAGRPERYLAELGTAAWVWGAVEVPPPRAEFCVDLRARARPLSSPDVRVREVSLRPDDVCELGAFRVTTPLRTVIDLARIRNPFTAEDARQVRELVRIAGLGLADCIAAMEARRNLPAKHRAVARLRLALDQPVPEAAAGVQPALTR